jgi:hypothetical protein
VEKATLAVTICVPLWVTLNLLHAFPSVWGSRYSKHFQKVTHQLPSKTKGYKLAPSFLFPTKLFMQK